MKKLGTWLLYGILGVGIFLGGAVLSVRLSEDDPPERPPLDESSLIPADRAGGLPADYEPPAPEDTPCLQPEYVTRCIGRSTARTGLMELAALQRAHVRERGEYAEDPDALGFRAESGMALRMTAGPDGWSAQYRHAAAGVGCAVFEGEVEEPFTTVSGGIPASAGAVACDDPLATGR